MVLELSARELKDAASEDALIREECPGQELGDRPQASQSASASANKPMSLAVTVCVCLVFTAVGPTLILTNKYLMSRCKFPYPILLTCSGQISSSVISFFLVRVCKVVPLTPMPWPVYFRSVSTVGLVACLAMASGNSTYLYLTVSFIEILKGFTPVVTIMVQALFGQAFPRPIAGVAVLMISLGTSISSFGEIDLNLLGVSLMLGSIYCEAMRLMLTQRLLQDKRMHVLETLYYLSPATLLWLMPLAYLVDVRKMDVPAVLAELPHSWHLFVLSTLIGFLVNTSSFMVIQRTNVVMLKLLAIARNAVVVFSGIVLFQDRVTPIQFLGYAITLFFFVLYNVFQFHPELGERLWERWSGRR